jgi:hypothetical protein
MMMMMMMMIDGFVLVVELGPTKIQRERERERLIIDKREREREGKEREACHRQDIYISLFCISLSIL